jgi:nitrite reductase (NADH) large subunit
VRSTVGRHAARPVVRFPNYSQLRRRVPIQVWHVARVTSVAVFLGLCLALFLRPAGGLFFFWKLLVPLLPITFLIAPGLWRNVCPLAAANQAPRLWGLTRGLKQPNFLRFRGHAVAIALFVLIVTSRKPLLDKNGPALSVLLLLLIAAAFSTGATWKGKSGWCSSICPLLPVQRLYGQTPFVSVANSHCQPCVGCTKNCYDFNPGAAYQADMHDADPGWSAPRKLFAGAFPGLIYGFFSISAGAGPLHVYGHILLFAAVGAGILYTADAVLPVTSSQVALLGAVSAANLFYWYQGPAMAKAWGQVLGTGIGWFSPVIRTAVPVVTAVWFARSLLAERSFVQEAVSTAVPVTLSATRIKALSAEPSTAEPEVVFLPDERRIAVVSGTTLLELAESDERPIEAGCRMGMCGSDPIAVLEGMEHLSPIGADEASTLRRLGLGAHVRMACSARVLGQVCVSLATEELARTDVASAESEAVVPADPLIRQVVVLGNGVAGVTAADFVRRQHPDCEIHLVGKEQHNLYNRMGISRVVYGRSAMRGLYLLPEKWYDDKRVTCWLNTKASAIDTQAQNVTLATGETLEYDRLILAMGRSSFVPPLPGYGLPGSFVLREADDAVAIRRYVQNTGATRAVVAGGGLLGLEAAHALHQLGLATTVLEQGPRLLMRQIDERASELLMAFLVNRGLDVVTGTSATRVGGSAAVTEVTLSDGRCLPTEVLLVAVGIVPNTELAVQAGIATNRGVVVDEGMRTSASHVYAAGDVAELNGTVYGLWPVAVNQAEVAARNALGGNELSNLSLPPTILKGVGIDLLSVGRFQPEGDDEVFVLDNERNHEYAKVVAHHGVVVGGLALGRPGDHQLLLDAVKAGTSLSEVLARLPVNAVAEAALT